jgi:alginate O-acetyltransferase complex protein AlgI
MLFCSQQFVLFFIAVFVVHWAMPWHRARVWLLLAASFYFYAKWNQSLALLIAASTVADYFVARGMDRFTSPYGRRALLALSLIGNLGLLAYFKYANFFLHSVEEALTLAGNAAALPVLQVILPVGISFYTFEAINYTVDVYRKKLPAERDLGHFMLFITFFPHLVAGPIVRARDFLPQVRRRKRWNWCRFQVGAGLIVLGLLKKMAVGDRMALFVDPVFAQPALYGTRALWMASVAYAIQIYCDFSGYSDLALGTAHLLGYRLAVNFNMPYLAANIADFWRRWHISLSSWLRDYIYIPLGGSRGAATPASQGRRTDRNLMVTMALGGLWHGAAWTFVVWGLLHGVYLIVQRRFAIFAHARPRLDAVLQSRVGTAMRVSLTLLAVTLGWVLFRATDFTKALEVYTGLFTHQAGLAPPMVAASLLWLLAGVAIAHFCGVTGLAHRLDTRLPASAVGIAYAAAVVVALVLAPDAGKVFIYFQF